MNLLSALQINASGLTAQRVRMNVISSNLANINSTRGPGGKPYQRKEVIFAAFPIAGSLNGLEKGSPFDEILREVRVVSIVEDRSKPKLVYDPHHPDANNQGYVALPNINLIEEMTNMISATRSYEANVTAINALKGMVLKALEIGG